MSRELKTYKQILSEVVTSKPPSQLKHSCHWIEKDSYDSTRKLAKLLVNHPLLTTQFWKAASQLLINCSKTIERKIHALHCAPTEITHPNLPSSTRIAPGQERGRDDTLHGSTPPKHETPPPKIKRERVRAPYQKAV